MESAPTCRISEQALKKFCAQLLERVGVPRDEASITTDNLIEADLRGVSSHGVVRLPLYVQRIVDGGTNPRPNFTVVHETRTTAVVGLLRLSVLFQLR